MELEALPVGYGDCLLLSWREHEETRRLIVDGGPRSTADVLRRRIEELPAAERAFELLVVSHIDCDHIDGALALLRDPPSGFVVRDVWFNGYRHLPPDNRARRGVREGIELDETLDGNSYPRNRRFSGGAVVRPDDGVGAALELPGGMRLTVLSPTLAQLARLRPVWDDVVERAQRGDPEEDEVVDTSVRLHRGGTRSLDALAATVGSNDRAPANASSIAILAEFGGLRCVLAADAVPQVLLPALEAVRRPGEARLALDLCKVPHHGSAKNVPAALVAGLDCSSYVFSTNGARFGHPDPPAVARVILEGGPEPELFFNYRASTTTAWTEQSWQNQKPFRTTFAPADETLRVPLQARVHAKRSG